MNEILTCRFSNCNKYFQDPVLLPCSKNICKSHIDEMIGLSSIDFRFTCEFCLEQHEVPDQGFTLNESLVEILNLGCHLENRNERLAFDLKNRLDILISEFNLIRSSPDLFIYEYIANVRNQID